MKGLNIKLRAILRNLISEYQILFLFLFLQHFNKIPISKRIYKKQYKTLIKLYFSKHL